MNGPAYWRAGSGSVILEGCWFDQDPSPCEDQNPEFVVSLGDRVPEAPPAGWRGYHLSGSSNGSLPDRWEPLWPSVSGTESGARLVDLGEGPWLDTLDGLKAHETVFLDARSSTEDERNVLHTLPVRGWLQADTDSVRPPYYAAEAHPRFASGRDPLFTFVHGYTGSPGNWDPLVEQLGDRAYAVPLLPGHGLPPGEFAKYGSDEWIGAVEYWSRRLAGDHDRRIGVGLSMGGALSVLSWEHYDALVLINTPWRVPDWRRMFFPVYEWVRTYHRFEESDKTIPVSSLRDLQDVLERCRERLEGVEVPVLVINHEGDETVTPNHGRVFANRLPDADHRVLEGGTHESPTEPDVAKQLHEEIIGWLSERNLLTE